MFDRLKFWVKKDSGMREAIRDASRETTFEALSEGFPLGVQDWLDSLCPKVIEVQRTLTEKELKTLRKPQLIELALERNIDADETMTVEQIKEKLLVH